MKNYVQEIKTIFQREAVCADYDDELLRDGNERLAHILSEAAADDGENDRISAIELVRSFVDSDEVQKRKVLSFCVDFHDPTVRANLTTQGELICRHAYLSDDEFGLLCRFVKRHKDDSTFGEVVYTMAEKHGMTPPQAYKNAFLRRQDFSRAVDPNVKNITRQIAWQIIIGLHCSLDEADEVLFSAGYIRRRNRFDLIMEYFIRNQNYDIMAINDVLSEFKLKPFSCDRPVRDDDTTK